MRKTVGTVLFGLIAGAMLVTALRAIRLPNDFAEAHWLIDYRFGFTKRGLIGSLTVILADLGILPQSESSITTLSFISFALLFVALLSAMYRVLLKTGWSTDSFLATAVFATSPFIVLSGHLVGYFDSILIVLMLVSAWLVLRDRPWLAAGVAAAAVLVHESFMLIGPHSSCSPPTRCRPPARPTKRRSNPSHLSCYRAPHSFLW